MVKFIQVTLLLLAALFLSRGPAAYGPQSAPVHIYVSHAELVLHPAHAPMDGNLVEKQCSKAGCAIASCQLQSAAAAVLPDCPIAMQFPYSSAWTFSDDASFSSLRNGPPSPPPKSPIGYRQAA